MLAHFDWQSAVAGATLWWILSAALHAVPPAGEGDSKFYKWLSAFAQAAGANLDRLKGINTKEEK